jgi:hypothetical protein
MQTSIIALPIGPAYPPRQGSWFGVSMLGIGPTSFSGAEKFLEKGKNLGGEKVDYGDATAKLHFLLRVPLIFVLWKKEEEFESQIHLILDKNIKEQMNMEGMLLALFSTGKCATRLHMR